MKNKFIPVCEPLLEGKELEYVTEAIKTGWISSEGKFVKLFEDKFTEYCGAKYAVSTCSGTTALHLALISLSIGKDDEIIIPSFTMIASAFAVCYTGAKLVFVDVEKDTWNINPDLIEEKITTKTKAIMIVSIFGHPCEIDKIKDIAKKYKLIIIEDAAESHGAEYKGIKTGNLADITAFSFYANKNLTTGEGGMVLTNNKYFYKKLLYYKNLCFPLDGSRSYVHNDVGFNYRMSNIHGAIGLAQVEKADYYREKRIANGRLYRRLLKNVPGVNFQMDRKYVLNVYWMNGIIIDCKTYGRTRDELIAFLKDNSVDTRLFFTGLHRQKSLQKYGCDITGNFPVTDYLTDNGFYLPSSSSLTIKDIEYICELIRGYVKN